MKPAGLARLALVMAVMLTGAAADAGTVSIASSPTAAMKAYYEAAKKKDTATMKSVLSKASLKVLENPHAPVDSVLRAMTRDLPATLEVRNERIEGDTATLEVRNVKRGGWETTHFVKEDGQWKIALDKDDRAR